MDEKLKKIASKFVLQGEPIEIIKYGEGHINDTYRIKCQEPDGRTNQYILQRINTNIFKEPVNLIENIFNVTKHIRGKIEESGGDVMKETLNLVEANDGKYYTVEEEGGFYRAYNFIEGARTYQVVESRGDFYKSGQALGRFQKHLSDFESSRLHETIKDFHNTEKRFADFKQSIEEDKFKRVEECREEVAFFLKREEDTKIINRLVREGKLPLRVTHNDTKYNNVMIDDKTREAICLLDLDTVMPGVSLYDFGDSIRSGATTAEEDEKDLSKVNFDLGLFEAYTKGYLDTARGFLTKKEVEFLPFSARIMTFECGMRFLKDYIDGDIYYKVGYGRHNLNRARNQVKLVKDMEKNYKKMIEIVRGSI